MKTTTPTPPAKTVKTKGDSKMMRISLDASTHRLLRIYAAERDLTLSDAAAQVVGLYLTPARPPMPAEAKAPVSTVSRKEKKK